MDMMKQYALERDIGICAISEPIGVPESNQWFSSENNLAAIFWQPDRVEGVCRLIRRSQNYVAVRYDNLHLISCYISPNVNRGEYL